MTKTLILACTFLLALSEVNPLNMVASVRRPAVVQKQKGPHTKHAPPKSGSGALTSDFISTLAVSKLKNRLRKNVKVECFVSAEPRDLLRGRVGPVTVRGRGWTSPLGLTCRAIEASIEDCELDIKVAMQRQKLKLTVPAKGDAMVALNEADFGEFLTHKFLKPPPQLHDDKLHPINFLKDHVSIDPEKGSVHFNAKFLKQKWRCTLQRQPSGEGCLVQVRKSSKDGKTSKEDKILEKELTRGLTDYFNELIFELDGTFLSFRDMMVTDKGKAATCMFALKILVKKFPSSGLLF